MFTKRQVERYAASLDDDKKISLQREIRNIRWEENSNVCLESQALLAFERAGLVIIAAERLEIFQQFAANLPKYTEPEDTDALEPYVEVERLAIGRLVDRI
jgi:hypothetical protein